MKKCSSLLNLPLGTYALQAVYRGQSFSKTIIKQ